MEIATTSESGPDVEIQVSDIRMSADESGVVYIIPKDEMNNALVLLEGAAALEVKGIEPPKVHSTPSGIQYFFTGALRRGQEIAIHIGSAVGRRVTLSVAFLRKEINKAWEKLPCNGCKLLVKTVTHAVLAYAGMPLVGLVDHIHFPNIGIHMLFFEEPGSRAERIGRGAMAVIGRLGTPDDLSDLSQFLTALPYWVAIKSVFSAFDWFFEATDRFYAWPCEKIGCCP